MSWIATGNGYVNGEHIVEIRDAPGGKERFILIGKNGESLGISYGFPMVDAAIPAYPGFTALKLYGDEAVVWTERQPIIGWIFRDGGTIPLIVDNGPAPDHDVLLPDGRVICIEDREFENEDEWRKYQETIFRKQLEANKKQA